MPYDLEPFSNPAAAYAYARCIEAIDYPGDPDRLTNALNMTLGTHTKQLEMPPSANNTRVIVATNARTTLILVGGSQFAGQFSGLTHGWLGTGQALSLDASSSFYIIDCARRIREFINASLITIKPRVVIAGYSLGGALAPFIPRINVDDPNTTYHVITFGAPKAFLTYQPIGNGVSTHVRWVTPTDPVPSLPPPRGQALLLHGLLSQQRSRYVDYFHHPTTPLVVSPSGVITNPTFAPGPAEFLDTTLYAIVNSRNGFFGPPHMISTYSNSLFAAIPPAPALPPIVAPPVTIRPRAPEVTPQLIDASRQAVNAFRASSTANDNIYPSIPTPARFRSYVTEGVWYVRWMGEDIAIGPTKKKCRAVCRHMNKMLRIFQGVGACNSTIFVETLRAYLADAADPAKGYKPTLRVNGGVPFGWWDFI